MVGSQWFSTGQVAEMLGFSRDWVRDQIANGLLPASRLAGSNTAYRISRADLAQFCREQLDLDLRELTR